MTIGEYTWNRPASMMLPGGARKTYAYDPLMRLKQINTIDPGGNPLLDYSYGYDKMDNIATRTTEHGAYVYDYDDTGSQLRTIPRKPTKRSPTTRWETD